MNTAGLARCLRFAYPPNALHLCGPEKQTDLLAYHHHHLSDRGTDALLQQFGTMYPYLKLIAGENGRDDPFDPEVVDSYWLGNALLNKVTVKPFVDHLDTTLELKKKLSFQERETLYTIVANGGIPHHAFHVLNVYLRTGHIEEPQTIATMDACIINWGTVLTVHPATITLSTRPLRAKGTTLIFGSPMMRTIHHDGTITIHKGDIVSYHWGKYCTTLSQQEKKNLQWYTAKALQYANTHHLLLRH